MDTEQDYKAMFERLLIDYKALEDQYNNTLIEIINIKQNNNNNEMLF